MELKKAIFDMDGLIFDSERLFMEKLGAAMAEKNYILTHEVYVESLGLNRKSVEENMKSVYGADYPFDELSKAARAEMRRAAKKGIPVKKGIPELLEYLKKRGTECVVASSSETRFVRDYIEGAGLSGYFTELIGGETVSRSKPEPDIFLKALGDTPKENAVIFEDSENGVKAAINAEIGVICIPDMKCPAEEVLKNVLACVNDAAEAAVVIEKLYS